jgi:hypothetical protein
MAHTRRRARVLLLEPLTPINAMLTGLGDHAKAAIDDQVKSGHREALPQIW